MRYPLAVVTISVCGITHDMRVGVSATLLNSVLLGTAKPGLLTLLSSKGMSSDCFAVKRA